MARGNRQSVRRTNNNRINNNATVIRMAHPVMQADGLLTNPEDFAVPFTTPGVPNSIPRHIGNQTYWYRTAVDRGGFSSSTGGATIGTILFTLNDIPGLSGVTAVFDQYCIVGVEVSIIPSTTSLVANCGILNTAIDYDSTVSPSTIDELLEFTTCRQSAGNIGHCRFIYPMINSPTQSTASAVLTGGSNTRSWLDCSYDTTAHFGLHYGINATSNVQTYQIRCRYWIIFRQGR